MGATFFLGTHQPGWLNHARVHLFVCDRRLRDRKTLPRAAAPWALDSGGFTELRDYGRWTVTPREYVARVRRYRDEIGALQWAAPQDWMCEPIVISGGALGPQRFVGTHLSVAEHQRRTVANLAQLREMAPDLPFIPVLQGYTLPEYEHCADLYAVAGIDLSAEPLVGLGSVCRRQGTREVHTIITALHGRGIHSLHGFGVKTLGLDLYADLITSADSLAWSLDARLLRRPSPWCTGHRTAKNCASCLPYALAWRARNILPASAPEPMEARRVPDRRRLQR